MNLSSPRLLAGRPVGYTGWHVTDECMQCNCARDTHVFSGSPLPDGGPCTFCNHIRPWPGFEHLKRKSCTGGGPWRQHLTPLGYHDTAST